jgi:hypothetical protein
MTLTEDLKIVSNIFQNCFDKALKEVISMDLSGNYQQQHCLDLVSVVIWAQITLSSVSI